VGVVGQFMQLKQALLTLNEMVCCHIIKGFQAMLNKANASFMITEDTGKDSMHVITLTNKPVIKGA
jgi:hypothetical protein